MIASIEICEACRAKLRAVRDASGEVEMCRKIGEVLCEACLSRVPGYQPGRMLKTNFKRKLF